MTDYRLPENAEASIVGCLLIAPDTKRTVSKLITQADFLSPLYGAMYSAALELDEPDSVAFHEAVKAKGYTLPDGFFRGLADVAINPSNVELYARLLREASMKRKLLELAKKVQESIDEGQNAQEVITVARAGVEEIERGVITNDIADPHESLLAFLEHRRLVESGSGAIPTGFAPLDKILGGGMLRSGLYILAARPGMGKTTFALQIADSIAEKGPVLFVSLEMSVEQITGKRLARISGVSSTEVLLGDGQSPEQRRVHNAMKELNKLPVYVSRKPSATVAEIRQMAKRLGYVEAIVIDYLGKVSPADRRINRYEGTTQISGDLKTLAVELGVPVLALAQLNRENTARQDKRPQLSDLRDSGSIEQDADGVIMLHREDYYEMSEKPLGSAECVKIECLVRKNRHGNIGACSGAFFPAVGRIIRA